MYPRFIGVLDHGRTNKTNPKDQAVVDPYANDFEEIRKASSDDERISDCQGMTWTRISAQEQIAKPKKCFQFTNSQLMTSGFTGKSSDVYKKTSLKLTAVKNLVLSEKNAKII